MPDKSRRHVLIETLEPRLLLAGGPVLARHLGNSSPVSAVVVAAQVTPLQVTYNGNGVSGLTYNGVSLLDPGGSFTVSNYTLRHADGTTFYSEDWQGGYTIQMDLAAKKLTWSYAWGSVVSQYTQVGDRLNLTITVRNTSATDTLMGLNIFAMRLRFPQALPGPGYPEISFGADAPGVAPADFGSGVMVMANEDPTRQLYTGLYTLSDVATTHRYNVLVGSNPLHYNPTAWPVFNRSIAPGQSDTYNVSLRFGVPGTSTLDLANDVYQKFAAAYPYQLNWADRRPIAKLFPTGSGPSGRSATNPRGWFADPSVDVTTPAGLASFRTRLLKWADSSVVNLLQRNAQGMITWDVEGEQWPQATTYIGDPRLTSRLAPETDYLGVIDEYFSKFRNAGLRVGVTIRPQTLVFDANGTPSQQESADPAQTMIDKINYARQRWGATLFYVDSNSDYDASVFERVAAAEPGALIFPEHSSIRHYDATAPYHELRQGFISTAPDTRRAYPGSFGVFDVSDGNITGNRAALVQAVRYGDILMFRGWFDSAENAAVQSIYAEAAAAPHATVSGRAVFYNSSYFDGNDPAANSLDDNAVATDKRALLPGQTATFANYTSYSRGLNGIMVDIAGLGGSVLSAADFSFRVGNSSSTDSWTLAPSPSSVSMRPGAGVNGSTRITLIWADNAIQKQWLQVTVLLDANTLLASPDVFYFGNAIGETGNSVTDADVDSGDELVIRNHGTGLQTASITNPYDINRDRDVNTQDQLITRGNRSGLSPINLIAIPAASPGVILAVSRQITGFTVTAPAALAVKGIVTNVNVDLLDRRAKLLPRRLLPHYLRLRGR